MHYSTSLTVDKIKITLQENLKIITNDICNLIFGLDKLNNKSASNLLQTQDNLSNIIEFVHSSLSKKFDSVQIQLPDMSSQVSSALMMFSDLSRVDSDKKEEEEEKTKDNSKKRNEPDSKRTDKGPDQKKSKS